MLKDNAKIKENYKNICEGKELLSQIKEESIKAVFFDPQYRGILDKLSYGNEGKQRGKARIDLEQMDFDTIQAFFKAIHKVLAPSGYLFLWVDKFHLVEGVKDWFKDLPDMQCVDMITWNKKKMGMGYRTRRKGEYLVVIQKKPILAKATWTIHNIPDVWEEEVVKTHAHSKPVILQEQLILAVTEKGDYVCDPASGGYSVFEACRNTGRNFIGGDIAFGEEIVKEKSV